MRTDIEIFCTMPEHPPVGWKKKMGIFGWSGETLFVPSECAGLAKGLAALYCCIDGVPFHRAHNVILVPEQWARKQSPERADVFNAIRVVALKVKMNPSLPPSRAA